MYYSITLYLTQHNMPQKNNLFMPQKATLKFKTRINLGPVRPKFSFTRHYVVRPI